VPLGFDSTKTRPTAVKLHEFLQKVFQQEAKEERQYIKSILQIHHSRKFEYLSNTLLLSTYRRRL
jgi:hypothetical protein